MPLLTSDVNTPTVHNWLKANRRTEPERYTATLAYLSYLAGSEAPQVVQDEECVRTARETYPSAAEAWTYLQQTSHFIQEPHQTHLNPGVPVAVESDPVASPTGSDSSGADSN